MAFGETGFGVAFGETGLGTACGVDLVVGLEVGSFDFVFADLEVVEFFLEAAGVAFFQ